MQCEVLALAFLYTEHCSVGGYQFYWYYYPQYYYGADWRFLRIEDFYFYEKFYYFFNGILIIIFLIWDQFLINF